MTDLNPEQFDQMWLQFAALGAERERERIIELLEENADNRGWIDMPIATLIQLLEGEQK